MIIDFHTHIFPDKLAEKTIRSMAEATDIAPWTYGSLNEELTAMEESGADMSIILPVATKVSQFDSINKFAREVSKTYDNGKRIMSFAGIHPYDPDYKEKLKLIAEWGFKGIKVHPDYQEVYINDPKMIRLIDYASELGLIVVTHAGHDSSYVKRYKCTPPMIRDLLDAITPEKFVLAHMGGLYFFDEVEKLIVGENVYFDTAYLLGKMDDEQLVRMARNHGMDKILFGSDLPWCGQKFSVEYLRGMKEFSDEEKEMIFSKNALKLLDMESVL